MDRLIAETEQEIKQEKITKTEESVTQAKTEVISEKKEEIIVNKQPPINSYLNSFENKTIADIKREEEKKQLEEFEKEKEELIKKQYAEVDNRKEKIEEKTETVECNEPIKENIIEKPNYDLIGNNKKIIRLKSNQKTQKPKSKKVASIILACALGVCSVICVTNTIIIDQMQSSYIEIDKSYNFKLGQYFKNIYNLDSAKNGTEMIETYPEETRPAGDLGQKSNWFDRICNFIARLFGG